MAIAVEGHARAHPFEQGRLGQDVEEILATLATLAERVGTGEEEDEKRRAVQLASYAAMRLCDLADRAEEVGPLCASVERELMLAESFMATLSAKAVMWTLGDRERPFLGAGEAGETVRPPVSRSEYVRAMMRLAISMRLGFPGDTARRWMRMAQRAAADEAPGARVIL